MGKGLASGLGLRVGLACRLPPCRPPRNWERSCVEIAVPSPWRTVYLTWASISSTSLGLRLGLGSGSEFGLGLG